MQTILPVILRVTLSLILWTLGATMELPAAEAKEHRALRNFAPDTRTTVD